MTASRQLLIVLSLVIVGGALGLWYTQWRSDEALRDRLESFGRSIAGVALEVDSASLRGERATLRGITLNNPEGFQSAYALRIETLSVRFAATGVGAGTWRIAEVSAEGLQAIFETRGETSNLEEVLDRLESYSMASSTADAWNPAAVTLQQLRAGPGRVRVQLEGDSRLRETEMPAIGLELREAGPVAAAALASEALAIVIRRAITAGAEVVLRDLVRETRPAGTDGLERAADSLTDELERSGLSVSP